MSTLTRFCPFTQRKKEHKRRRTNCGKRRAIFRRSVVPPPNPRICTAKNGVEKQSNAIQWMNGWGGGSDHPLAQFTPSPTLRFPPPPPFIRMFCNVCLSLIVRHSQLISFNSTISTKYAMYIHSFIFVITIIKFGVVTVRGEFWAGEKDERNDERFNFALKSLKLLLLKYAQTPWDEW